MNSDSKIEAMNDDLAEYGVKPWDSEDKKQRKIIERYLKYGSLAINDVQRKYIKNNISSRGIKLPWSTSLNIWQKLGDASNLMDLTYPILTNEHYTTTHDSQVIIDISYDALDDENFDILDEIIESTVMAMGASFDDMMLRGDGKNKPLGIYKNEDIPERIVTIPYIKSGEDMIPDLEVLKPALMSVYDELLGPDKKPRNNYACWIMNEDVQEVVLGFEGLPEKENTDYFIAKSGKQKEARTFLGRQIVCTEYAEDFIHGHIPIVLMVVHEAGTRRSGNIYVKRSEDNTIRVTVQYNIEYSKSLEIIKVKMNMPENGLYMKPID